MKFKIGVIMNADGYSCVPHQSIRCVKHSLKLLSHSLPRNCCLDLRLKPGNNSFMDYYSLVLDSYLTPQSCQISISSSKLSLDDWISDKNIFICFMLSSAIHSVILKNKKLFLIKNQCIFFPPYLVQDDAICPIISPKVFSDLVFGLSRN